MSTHKSPAQPPPPVHDLSDVYREIVEYTADCIKILDVEGRLLWVNTEGQRLLEICDLEPYRCAYWPDLWVGEARDQAVQAVATALDGGVGRFSGPCPTARGVLKWWNVTVTRLPSLPSHPVRLLSISRDVTELAEAAERERMLARAERSAREVADSANEAKERLLFNVSHQLRNPLNGIVGWLDMLLAAPDSESREDAATAIEQAVEQQMELIGRLLEEARRPRGSRTLTFAPAALEGAVERALVLLRPSAIAKGLELHVQPPSRPLTVHADAAALQEVLVNLLANAIKFTPAGGTIYVSGDADDRAAIVEVRDTGLGIDPAQLPRVFDRFWQSDDPAVRRNGGLGLGLAIVRDLVELHGGDVEAHSDGRGHGSRFLVRWPLSGSMSGTGEADQPTHLHSS